MSYNVLSDLIITKILFASTMYNKKEAENKRTNRERWAIISKYEGETIYSSCGKQYVSNKNNLVILPKGCSYKWKCTKSGHYSVIEFESELTYDEIMIFPVKNSEKILKIFKNLETARMRNDDISRLESMRDIYTILSTLAASEPKKYLPSEKQHKIAPAVNYITENYNIKIKNDELAALVGVSTVYFRKIFTDVYGQSPIDYIRALRIQKAKEMLKSDYGSISDVAEALGYQNIYDFSRTFKKLVGVSPKNFKQTSDN